jgi:general secretion pathway protein E
VSAITRLQDLGVPPYLISATVIGVLAQRLVRTLCPACKQPDESITTERLDEVVQPWQIHRKIGAYKPVGCLECRMTGYRGRAGLYELLTLDGETQAALHPQIDIEALRRISAQNGLRPLRVAGVAKVAQGVTTLEEVLRSTPVFVI